MLKERKDLSQIVWKIIQSTDPFSFELMNQEAREDFLNHFYIPHKGFGNIQVAESDVDKAIELLKNHVGEYEFKYYYVNGFITDKTPSKDFNYGKFEIKEFREYLNLLMENNVKIIDIYLTSS